MEQREKEPALKAGAFATAIVALLLAYRIVTAQQALAWGTLLTMLLTALVPLAQALWTRWHVIPVDTVKAAGLDPEAVNRAADDPSVAPFVEPPAVG
jgi:hypothetical protein